MIQEAVKSEIEKVLDEEIIASNSVGGGSINEAAKINTVSGKAFFLKWNGSAPVDMFPKEKRGLELLASAKTGLRVPQVVVTGTAGEADFIFIEFINKGSGNHRSAQKFGRQLAALHKVTNIQYGLDYDNYIGRLSQSNNKHENWIEFFIEERLQPQLKQAINSGKLDEGILKKFRRLYKRLPDMLPEEPASLLHGDLWSGNYFFDEEGNAAIFDPAVYYGNREIEIAFTHLFGGFSSAFYDAYQETFPLEPNFNKRKDIYNLYPLLVHTNMFGGHYGRQVASIVKQF